MLSPPKKKMKLDTGSIDGATIKKPLKMYSWNVNGMKTWIAKGGLAYLKEVDADIFAIQETKCHVSKLPREALSVEGYHSYFTSTNAGGYSGVGIYSKIAPRNVRYDRVMGEEHEGRVLTLEFGKFYFVTVYVPSAGRQLAHLQLRMKWDMQFREYIKELDQKKLVVVCGDFNVAHTTRDLCRPKENTRKSGFTKEEREAFSTLLKCGFVDSFRYLYPKKNNVYTFWSYVNDGRIRNAGWRQDYFLVSEAMIDKVKESSIHDECGLGSDHCPISIDIDQ